MKAYLYVKKEIIKAKGQGKEREVLVTELEKYKVAFNSKTAIRKWLKKKGMEKAFDPNMVEWKEYGRFTKLSDGTEILFNYYYNIGL